MSKNQIDIKQIWQEDGDKYNATAHKGILYAKPAPVKEFLQVGEADQYCIIIGAKGTGKSMLLREKARLYLEEKSGYLNLETGGSTVESVDINEPVLEELLSMQNTRDWKDIWLFAICVLIIKNDHIEAELPEEIRHEFERVTSIGSIVTRVFRDRQRLGEFVSMNEVMCDSIRDTVQRPAFLCIDNVDGCMSSVIKDFPVEDYRQHEMPAEAKVWTNSQIGLMEAVVAANKLSAHLKVNAAVRKEVVDYIEGHLRSNLLAKASTLEFTKSELKGLLTKRIRLIPVHQLSEPAATEEFERLIGIKTIPHRYVKAPNGKPVRESIFDYFIRHGFRRPRDLTAMGREVSNTIQRNGFRSEEINKRTYLLREAVTKQSKVLFRNYINEVMPNLRVEEVARFIRKLDSNVISKRFAKHLDEEDLRYYYNLGLLGVVKINPNFTEGGLYQHFEQPAANSYLRQELLPKSDYYLVHSCLDHYFVTGNHVSNDSWYDPRNIISHEHPFIPPENEEAVPGHWIPEKFSGGRHIAPHATHTLGLLKYYEDYTTFHHSALEERYEQQLRNVDDKFCEILHACLQDEAEKLSEDHALSMGKQHTKKLTELNYGTRMLFSRRMQYRLIAVAANLLLDLPADQLYSIFREGRFRIDFSDQRGNKRLNYLQSAFYVDGFTARWPNSEIDRIRCKEKVFAGLSVVEKSTVRSIAERLPDLAQLVYPDRPVVVKRWLNGRNTDWLI